MSGPGPPRRTSMGATLVFWAGIAIVTGGVYEWFGRGPALVTAGLLFLVVAYGLQQRHLRTRGGS